jgi:hypothetical protein
MNNPVSPSDDVSSATNLYKLSASETMSKPDAAVQSADLEYAESKIIPWRSAHCDDPIMNYPRWNGFPVTLCDYSDIGVTVKTYMLNADRAKQARWTVTACSDAKAKKNMRKCIDYMIGQVREASSGGIFPIAGYIPEPQDGGRCYVFRDGVTVWTKLRPYWQSPKNHSCGPVNENDQPLDHAWKFARIASTTRGDYIAAGGSRPVDGLNWVDVTRDLYQKAWNSDRNELMSAKAIGARQKGLF